MKKNIWIINHYATSMLLNKGGRHYSIAKYLRQFGYNVTVFSSNALHNSDGALYDNNIALWKIVQANEIDVPFVLIKSRPYIGNGRSRLFNIYDFYKNVLKSAKEYARMTAPPDVIYASSVHPLAVVAGIKLAHYYNVPCICEIRDLWPESLISYGVLARKSLIAKFLRFLEKWIYLRSNAIIFTMEGGYDYIKKQGWESQIPHEKVYYVNNGVDISEFEYNKANYIIDDNDLTDYGSFKVVYTGSIRKANKLDLLVKASSKLNINNVKILVWGNGDDVDSLKSYVRENSISNVVFKGGVQKKWIPHIMSCADANFLDPFDERIAQYGISSNKLFEYLAAGKPIIMNKLDKYNPIRSSGCYSEYDNTPDSIADSINKILEQNKDNYLRKCECAKLAATKFSYSTLARDIQHIIEAL